MFSHSLSNTGRAFREGLPYPYVSIFTSCSKHVITTELSGACWEKKLQAWPLAHQRKAVPRAQPRGFAACQLWKWWWGWDGIWWGCSTRGACSLLDTKGASASPCSSCSSRHGKGPSVKIRASSLFSVSSRGSCEPAPGPKPTGTFRALQRERTFIELFVSSIVCN